MKISITSIRSLLLFVATLNCSQKKQQSFFEILPKEVTEKIVSYTPIATKENLLFVSRDMFRQAYFKLDNHRLNSFRNYLSFLHLCFPSQNAALSFRKKFQHYSYEVQQKDLSTLKSILEKDENYTIFYTMLMNHTVSSYFMSDTWIDEFDLKRCSTSATIERGDAGIMPYTIKTVELSDDVMKKIQEFDKKVALELINKTLIININTNASMDSFTLPVHNHIVSTINGAIRRDHFIYDTDNVRMIFKIVTNKDNEYEHFNRMGEFVRSISCAYSNNVKIIDISNQGIAECGKDVALFAKLFPQSVKIFMSGDYLCCARKDIRKDYPNVFFRPAYIDESHESAQSAEDFKALDVDDITYLCENGFSIPLVYLIKNNPHLLCRKDNFPHFRAAFSILTKYISPLNRYKASFGNSAQEFTVIDALIQHFLKIPYEQTTEWIASDNIRRIYQSQEIYRPYIIQFADYIDSVVQNLGIDIKSYKLSESQKTILEVLLLQYEETRLQDKQLVDMRERIKLQNQQFKQQALFVKLSYLHGAKEIRFLEKDVFQNLFYTLLNLNVLEERMGKGAEIKYNLPSNLPETDCGYILSLMKQLHLGINYMFRNNATLLQNCLFYGNKLDQLKTQYQTMLIYKLINSHFDCNATEYERTFAIFFKNLPQFRPCDQINIFSELIKNIIKYDGHKTILHTYFKHASTLNLNIIRYIINRDNFDINTPECGMFAIEDIFFGTPDLDQEPFFEYSVERRTVFENFLYFCFRLRDVLAWNDSVTIFTIFIKKGFNFNQKTGTGKSFVALIDEYLAQAQNPLLAHLKGVLCQNPSK